MPFSNGVISIFANIRAHDCIIAGCGVNVLCRAFFISTYLESSILKLVKKGVNALYRAFFISTVRNAAKHNYELDVSMPCIGLSSFLQIS